MNEDVKALRQLQNISNELEVPSYVWEDTTNSITYICYATRKRVIETDDAFKIKCVIEVGDDIRIKVCSEILPICVGAINPVNIHTTLSGYYAANKFHYI